MNLSEFEKSLILLECNIGNEILDLWFVSKYTTLVAIIVSPAVYMAPPLLRLLSYLG